MLRDIKRAGDRVPGLAKMATRRTQAPGNRQPVRSAPLSDKPATMAAQRRAPFELPTDSRRGRWTEIASIAALLVVVIAGWWLVSSEVADPAQTTIPPTTRAGDVLAQIKQELQQERDDAEKLSSRLARESQELLP